jgi:hypothetical protein
MVGVLISWRQNLPVANEAQLTLTLKHTQNANGYAKSLRVQLLLWVGALIACPLVAGTIFIRPDFGVILLMVFMATFPMHALSFLALFYTAWRGVTASGLTKMEAWWWLSAPHSVAFWLCFRALRWERFASHGFVILFLPLFLITLVSTAAWTLVMMYRMSVGKPSTRTVKNGVLLLFALLLAVVLWA